MKWLKKNFFTLVLLLMLLAGAGLLLYPSFSDYWNSLHQSRAIISYAENVANLDTEVYTEILERARNYNERLAETGVVWTMTDEELEDYNNELVVEGRAQGSIGYIDIQKIAVRLPIYHGTSESILQTSIGHIEGTSLPVGGESSHCVLSGHRGLPSAKLFTDLDKLEVGDTFCITVLSELLTYEVDQIRIVEPTDLSELKIFEGEDYCTLVTCTPYGINTHRLLVRGHRIENIEGEIIVNADGMQIEAVIIAPFVAAPILIFLLITLFLSTGSKKRNKRR